MKTTWSTYTLVLKEMHYIVKIEIGSQKRGGR